MNQYPQYQQYQQYPQYPQYTPQNYSFNKNASASLKNIGKEELSELGKIGTGVKKMAYENAPTIGAIGTASTVGTLAATGALSNVAGAVGSVPGMLGSIPGVSQTGQGLAYLGHGGLALGSKVAGTALGTTLGLAGTVAQGTGYYAGVGLSTAGSLIQSVASLIVGNPFISVPTLLIAGPNIATFSRKYKNSQYNSANKMTFKERYQRGEFKNKTNQEAMNALYDHFSEPIGKYFQDMNDDFKKEFHKTPGWGLKLGKDVDKKMYFYRQKILLDSIKQLEGAPKDVIFLTFELSFSVITALKSAKSYLRPNFIGPRHILEKIHELFNIDNNVEKFIKVLDNLQRISFYNTKSFVAWRYNNTLPLERVCLELFEIMNKQRGTDVTGLADALGFNETENKLPKPSVGIKRRHGVDHNYSAVMFIGKNVGSKNIKSTELHKKWCWLKNSDGFIYDGEFLPADMQLLLDDESPQPKLNSQKMMINNVEMHIPYYEFEWAGFQVNIFDDKIKKGLKQQYDAAMGSMGYAELMRKKSRKNILGGKRKTKRKYKSKK
jgi:hypothetical protein